MLLLLLWTIASSGRQLDDTKAFMEVMRDTLWWLASGYIITSIIQAFLRSERYRSLLKADGTVAVPGSAYMMLITLSRNMFVDMVPARIGEASYILMLNRGYGLLVYAALPLSRWFQLMMEKTGIRLLQRFGSFVVDVGLSIKRVRVREMLSLTLLQSLGIRVFKYSGLYLLFIAVTTNSFSELSALPLWQGVSGLMKAEVCWPFPFLILPQQIFCW